MSTNNKKRNATIDILRLIAILLLVTRHTIGSDPTGGMRIDYPSYLRYFYLLTSYLSIPLFGAIAGYVYAIKPPTSFAHHFKSKFIRLMLPAYAVGVLYFTMQYFTPNTNIHVDFSSIWRIAIYPYTYFWFLPSLFVALLAQYGLDKFRLNDTFGKSLLIILLALIANIAITSEALYGLPNYLSYQGAILIFVYLQIGILARRYGQKIEKKATQIMGASAILLSLVLIQYTWNIHQGNVHYLLFTIVAPILRMGIIILLLNIKIHSKVLERYISFTMGIYLFHGFGTAGGRIILELMGINHQFSTLAFSSFLAIFGSIITVIIIRKIPYAPTILLGEKRKQ